MRIFVFVLLTLCLTSFTIADNTPIGPDETFMLADVKIYAPQADDWFLLQAQEMKVGFISETADHIKTAQVSLFSLPTEYQKDSFIALLKTTAKMMGKIVSESYSFSDSRGTPCANAILTTDVGKDGKTLLMQNIITACVIPVYKQQGLITVFSYTGDKPVPALDKEADAFFKKVEIPLVNMKPRKEGLTGDVCARGSSQLVEFIRSKGNGLTREGALKAAKQNPDELVIPTESINNLYDYPILNDGDHYGYFLWACIARKEGRKPLPLSNELAEELEACFKKGGDHICGKNISDRVKAGI